MCAYLGGACAVCGYNRCYYALHFHHRDKAQKRFAIAVAVAGADPRASNNPAGVKLRDLWTKDGRMTQLLRNELDKCVLLCATHHIEAECGPVLWGGGC
jgi:hypothetical protein